MQFIRCSPSNPEFFLTGYPAKHTWPFFAQCGGRESSTFFFEAFPDYGMIRADSKTSIQDAEQKAWTYYQKALACPLDHKDHANLDRSGYENGCSFCKGCKQYIAPDYSGLPPTTICVKCGIPTYYSQDNKEQWHCESCLGTLPDSELTDFQLERRYKRGVWEVLAGQE